MALMRLLDAVQQLSRAICCIFERLVSPRSASLSGLQDMDTQFIRTHTFFGFVVDAGASDAADANAARLWCR